MILAMAFFACNESKNTEQTEIKEEIQATESVNLEIDKAQEELEESIDDVDNLLNDL